MSESSYEVRALEWTGQSITGSHATDTRRPNSYIVAHLRSTRNLR